MSNIINILGKIYTVVDTLEKITIPDCWVMRANKTGLGNGEAKFYVGHDSNSLRDFFGNRPFRILCFMLKKDLLSFMDDCKDEYMMPEQNYGERNNFPTLWNDRVNEINTFPKCLKFVSSEQNQIEGQRLYIKSQDKPYSLLRKISLPNISYVSVIKLLDSQTSTYYYYFRPFIDYYGEIYHPKTIMQAEQEDIKSSGGESARRAGQQEYRKKLLMECPSCPMTTIADDRLLIASHIKPYVKSNEHEKYDSKNGFMFTPTYDHLFDRGYISFTNEQQLMVSPFLSKRTCGLLSLLDGKKIRLLPVEGREVYLDYHRNIIFKI